jgi:hypothetical protein
MANTGAWHTVPHNKGPKQSTQNNFLTSVFEEECGVRCGCGKGAVEGRKVQWSLKEGHQGLRTVARAGHPSHS